MPFPPWEKVLKGDDETVRWAAAASLVRVGGPGAKPGVRYLLGACRVPGNNLFDATNILTAADPGEALPALLDALRDADVRDTAAGVIQSVCLHLKRERVPDLKGLLKDPDAGVRCVTAWVLYCGQAAEIKEVVEGQRDALGASDAWARRQAARFLGSLGSRAADAAPALTVALEDKDEGVRTAAAEALKNVGRK